MVKHIFFLFAYVFLLKQDTMNQENEMVECQSKGSYYVWYFWIYTHMYIYIYTYLYLLYDIRTYITWISFLFWDVFFSTFYGSSCCFFPKNRGKFSGTPALSLGSTAPTAYLVYLESNAGWIVAQRDMVFSSIFKMLFWVPRQSQELLASWKWQVCFFRIRTVMMNSPQSTARFLWFRDFRSSLSQVGMAMSSWEARVAFWSMARVLPCLTS